MEHGFEISLIDSSPCTWSLSSYIYLYTPSHTKLFLHIHTEHVQQLVKIRGHKRKSSDKLIDDSLPSHEQPEDSGRTIPNLQASGIQDGESLQQDCFEHQRQVGHCER